MLGGENDDFLWTHAGSSVTALVRGAATLYTLFETERGHHHGTHGLAQHQASFDRAATESRNTLALQIGAYRRGVNRVRESGRDFVLAHDFLALDLGAPRSSARAEMFEARRGVVEAAGGRFLDLHRLTRTRAGVHWFNDYIHLSRFGHAAIMPTICGAITQGQQSRRRAAGTKGRR